MTEIQTIWREDAQLVTTCKRNCLKKLCVDKKVLSLQYASARRRYMQPMEIKRVNNSKNN